MTNFEKQWEAAAKAARLKGEFTADFLIRHPNVKLVMIHDSNLFESRDDYLLYRDELKKFLERRQHD